MKFLAAGLAALLFSQPLGALAQPSSAPAASQPVLLPLPPGKPIQSGSEALKGYTLEEFKILLRIHANYRNWGLQVPLLEKKSKDSESLANVRAKQLEIQDLEIDLLKRERTRLFEKWKQDNKLRHECENKPAFGNWIAWTAAAVMTAVAITLGALWLEARD